jgi:hypothetical protein
MNNYRREQPACRTWYVALLAAGACFIVAPASAQQTTVAYHATFIEPYGGPQSSPFSCPAGTSCGAATVAGFGHGSTLVAFAGCGPDCHVRTITLDDGSTLLINELGVLADFAAPGNAGTHGYIGYGLLGNPQFLEISQTIVSGTGQFEGATGSAFGTVKVAGGVVTIMVSGELVLPSVP